jgi:signal transduction histidine kinase
VEDTGIGIREKDIKSIFKAFTQVDTSATRLYGGTGLGLAITHSFCRIMGGDVTVTSTYGEGSCFTMRLPTNHALPEKTSLLEVGGEQA